MQNNFSKVITDVDVQTAKAMYERTASGIYVVINKGGTSVLQDPGLGRPWSSKVRKIADHMAAEVGRGASVVTLAEAARILMRNMARQHE